MAALTKPLYPFDKGLSRNFDDPTGALVNGVSLFTRTRARARDRGMVEPILLLLIMLVLLILFEIREL